MSEPSNPEPVARKRNKYGWMIYFAFLVIASIGVTVFVIKFSNSMLLTPEKLEAAQKLWKEKGPKNYDMIYKKRIGRIETDDVFAVKVRKGIVIDVKMNGEPLKANKAEGQTEDPRIYFSMDAIFRDLERFMDIDTKPNAPRAYVVGVFDEKIGAIGYYVRRLGDDRVELTITLKAVEE